jgi:hypothetical protein
VETWPRSLPTPSVARTLDLGFLPAEEMLVHEGWVREGEPGVLWSRHQRLELLSTPQGEVAPPAGSQPSRAGRCGAGAST